MYRFEFNAYCHFNGHPKRFVVGRVVNEETVLWRKQTLRDMYRPYVDLGLFEAETLELTSLGQAVYALTSIGSIAEHLEVPLPDSALLWGKTAKDDLFDFF